jgi:hypothetical protein
MLFIREKEYLQNIMLMCPSTPLLANIAKHILCGYREKKD